MRVDWPPRRRPIEGAGLNILLLTSEFAPAMGGIGTYAREIAAAATPARRTRSPWSRRITREQTGRRRPGPCPSRSSAFAAASTRCATCRPRSCWRAAASAATDYDVVHAADWPFFIPLALSQLANAGAGIDDRAWHRDQRDADAAEARWRYAAPACSDRGRESSPTAAIPKRCSASGLPSTRSRISAINLGVSEFWFGAPRQRREVRLAYRWRKTGW